MVSKVATSRCQFINVTNNLVCKKRARQMYSILGKRCCAFHYNYYAKESIIHIQRIFRGYKCRKYLKSIYNKLPYDVQKIVNHYLREEYYIDKYHNVLEKIVLNKLKNFTKYMDRNTSQYYSYILKTDKLSLNEYITFICNNYDYIEKNINLYLKYKIILEKNYYNYLDKDGNILDSKINYISKITYPMFTYPMLLNKFIDMECKLNIGYTYYRALEWSEIIEYSHLSAKKIYKLLDILKADVVA